MGAWLGYKATPTIVEQVPRMRQDFRESVQRMFRRVLAWVVSGWLGRRWRFWLYRCAGGYAVAQGWLVVYLSMPLVEWASHSWITIGWQLCITKVYNVLFFITFFLASAFLAHKLIETEVGQ
jgi:hypothetical protein